MKIGSSNFYNVLEAVFLLSPTDVINHPQGVQGDTFSLESCVSDLNLMILFTSDHRLDHGNIHFFLFALHLFLRVVRYASTLNRHFPFHSNGHFI